MEIIHLLKHIHQCTTNIIIHKRHLRLVHTVFARQIGKKAVEERTVVPRC